MSADVSSSVRTVNGDAAGKLLFLGGIGADMYCPSSTVEEGVGEGFDAEELAVRGIGTESEFSLEMSNESPRNNGSVGK
jgi:hypothetical protein